MGGQSVERRRSLRAELAAPLHLHRVGAEARGLLAQWITKNISLAGTYFEAEGDHPYAVNEVVMASITIPASEQRLFPFTRISGRSRVVRVEPLLSAHSAQGRRTGIALEFGDDLTALAAIPGRS